jgi:hypothetical protein
MDHNIKDDTADEPEVGMKEILIYLSDYYL